MNQQHPNGSVEPSATLAQTRSPRLIVLDQRGWVKLFAIGAQGVSIGSAPGNAVRLEGAGISRFHVRCGWEQGQITIVVLSEEYAVTRDGQRLVPHMPSFWHPTQAVRLGAFELRLEQPFSPTLAQPSPASEPGAAEPAQPIRGGLIGVELEQGKERLLLRPGQHEVVRVTLKNAGAARAELRLGLNGLPEGWVRLPAHPTQVDPQVPVTIPLTISVPDLAEAPAGDYSVTLSAHAADETIRPAQAHALWTVQAVAGRTELRIEPVSQRSGRRAHYMVRVRHSGNAPVEYAIALKNRAAEGLLSFEPEQFDLLVAPGKRAEQRVLVQAPEHRGARTREHHLVAEAQFGNSAEQAQAAFVQAGAWFWPLVVGALALLVFWVYGLLPVPRVVRDNGTLGFSILNRTATPLPTLAPTVDQTAPARETDLAATFIAQAATNVAQSTEVAQQRATMIGLQQEAERQRAEAQQALAAAVSMVERTAAAERLTNAQTSQALFEAFAKTAFAQPPVTAPITAQPAPSPSVAPIAEPSLTSSTLPLQEAPAEMSSTTPGTPSPAASTADSSPTETPTFTPEQSDGEQTISLQSPDLPEHARAR